MFPRGYFNRVGKVVGWMLLTIAAIIGLVQIFMRANVNGNEEDGTPSYEIAQMHIFKCNCNNNSSSTSPSLHASHCEYRKWYYKWIAEHKKKGDE